MNVEIHAPDTYIFLISLIIALLALVSFAFPIPYITPIGHWIALLAWVVLALGSVVKPRPI